MHRGNGNAQLVDGGCVNLVKGDGHAVVAGLLDAGDVGSGLAGLDACLIIGAEGGDGQHVKGGTGALNGNSLIDIAAEFIKDRLPEIFDSCILGQRIAPVGSAGSDGIGGGVVAVVLAVINDLLRKGSAGLVVIVIPESVVLLFGVEVGGGVAIRTGGVNYAAAAAHAAAILAHALNGNGIQRGVAVIGRVAKNVHREDDVVDGELFAVGEGDILTQRKVVVDSAVGVLNDLAVGRPIISIVSTVVADCFALDTVHNDRALTVVGEQADLRHQVDILVIGGLREERGELFIERGIAYDQWGVFLALVGLIAASGKKTQAHDQRQDQCKCSFHSNYSFFIYFASTGSDCPVGHKNSALRAYTRGRKGSTPFSWGAGAPRT